MGSLVQYEMSLNLAGVLLMIGRQNKWLSNLRFVE